MAYRKNNTPWEVRAAQKARGLWIGLVLVTTMSTAQAQHRFITAGDKAYARMAYAHAIDNYERAAEAALADTGYARRLADSYMNVRDFKQAEVWYARAVQMKNAVPIDFYNYAQVLRANGKYGDADSWLDTYASKRSEDSRNKRQAGALRYASKLNAQTIAGCEVINEPINTPGAEMGVAFFNNKQVIFSCDRTPGVYESRRHAWNGRPFLDLYQGTKGPAGIHAAQELNTLNTRFHESNATLSPDRKTIWFTRNNFSAGAKGRTPQGVINLKIYRRSLVNGEWVDERPFPYNSESHSVGHPCLSADGRTMYFTSDRPGGQGGTDIWRTDFTGSDWAAPICLGTEVNTEGDEMFPFIAADGSFFFSSDGHENLGGSDVFVGKVNASGTVSGVRNPGAPLNSGGDDFALVMDSTLLNGYFTSDRSGGKGGDDIYAIKLTTPLGGSKRIEGTISDLLVGSKREGATVQLKNSSGAVLGEVVTGPDGSYVFNVMDADIYKVSAAFPDFTTVHETVVMPDRDTVISRDLGLGKLKLWGKVSDLATGGPLEGVRLEVTDVREDLRSVVDQATNREGDVRTELKDRSTGDSLVYRVKLSKPGYLPKKGLFLYKVERMTEVDMREVMEPDFFKLEPIDVGIDLADAVEINPIYFDYGKHAIRKDASIELDKVVAIMKENPAIEIELGSHTDCRNSQASNMALSELRAKSSAAYIVKRGISRKRITSKGYGESRLINACACEGDKGSDCPEEEHQKNRRTEFIITKM